MFVVVFFRGYKLNVNYCIFQPLIPTKNPETLVYISGCDSGHYGGVPEQAQIFPYCRIIAIDLPSYGFSDDPPISFSKDFFKNSTDVIAQVLKKLNVEKVFFRGHGSSGELVAWIAKLYPEMTKGIIMVNPTGIKKYNPLGKLFLLARLGISAGILRSPKKLRSKEKELIGYCGKQPDTHKPFNTRGLARIHEILAICKGTLEEVLSDVKCPVKIIVGNHWMNFVVGYKNTVNFINKIREKNPDIEIDVSTINIPFNHTLHSPFVWRAVEPMLKFIYRHR